MGLYFRKSVNLGSFRLNFSKSGVGVSTGVKGFRYSVGPRGTSINIGRNGVYYRKQIGRHGHRQAASTSHTTNRSEEVRTEPERIHTADVSELVDSSSHELLDQLNHNLEKVCYGPLIRWSALIIACLTILLPLNAHWQTGFIILIPGLIVAAIADGEDKRKRTTTLSYEFQDEAEAKFEKIQEAFRILAGAERIQHIDAQQEISDWKHNAGAHALIRASEATIKPIDFPPLIATNVIAPSIQTKDQCLYFLPDQILVLQHGKYGSVPYTAFQVGFTSSRFIEEGKVPSDAQYVGTTWKFVNKDGTPDRRYTADNPEYPVLLYSYLHFSSASGLNICLQVSHIGRAEQFSRVFAVPEKHDTHESQETAGPHTGSHSNKQRSNRSSTTQQNENKAESDSDRIETPTFTSPYETLGIMPGTSHADISAAYHKMVQMYHPDKVAGLAPEFGQIAEKRMREINAAFETLTKER